MFPFRSDASRANRGKRRNETIAVPTATANVIEVENINRIFETGDTYTHVLKGITMNVRQGEFLAIMGPSGSGKSTLMNTLGLLDRPSSGTYRLCGMDVQNLSDDERSELRGWLIGFVFQSFNLLPRTSVLRNVMLPLAYSDCPVREREGRAIKALQSGHRQSVGTGPAADSRRRAHRQPGLQNRRCGDAHVRTAQAARQNHRAHHPQPRSGRTRRPMPAHA